MRSCSKHLLRQLNTKHWTEGPNNLLPTNESLYTPPHPLSTPPLLLSNSGMALDPSLLHIHYFYPINDGDVITGG